MGKLSFVSTDCSVYLSIHMCEKRVLALTCAVQVQRNCFMTKTLSTQVVRERHIYQFIAVRLALLLLPGSVALRVNPSLSLSTGLSY
jgi:hypothetical protein